MTIYARPTETPTVERHNDALWLCASDGIRSELLARFSDEAAAERFKQMFAAAKAHAHAAGASGI